MRRCCSQWATMSRNKVDSPRQRISVGTYRKACCKWHATLLQNSSSGWKAIGELEAQIKLIKRVLQLEQSGSDSETPVAYSALSAAYVVAAPTREPSKTPEELDEELGEERFLKKI